LILTGARWPQDRPDTEQERLVRGWLSGASSIANLLGLKPTTLASQINAFGIDRAPLKSDPLN